MQPLDIRAVGTDYAYRWPSSDEELYPHWIEYRAAGADQEYRVCIGFGMRTTYGRERKRVVVWIDGHPQAEFLGADDFERSGDVLCEIKLPGHTGERICRYPEERIPSAIRVSRRWACRLASPDQECSMLGRWLPMWRITGPWLRSRHYDGSSATVDDKHLAMALSCGFYLVMGHPCVSYTWLPSLARKWSTVC